MTFNDPGRLQALTNFDTLLDYLRDELGWPIEVENLDEAAYEYSSEELNINPRYVARITSIKQLRPLIDDQVWGIFFVEFDNNRLPVMALRRILQSLAVSRRQRDASIPAWKREDLLFICVYTSAAEGKAGQRGITFAHFRDEPGGQPELRTFSWDSRETHFYYIRNLNLNGLRWPANDRDANAWREQWRRAFTVRHRYTIRTAEKLASQMARQAVMIRELVHDLYEAEGEKGALHSLYERLRIDLLHDLQPDDFGDMIAQTITYGAFSAAVQNQREQPPKKFSLDKLADFIPDTNTFLKRMLETLTTQGRLDLDELGVGELVDLLRQIDLQAITRDFGRQTGSGSEDPVVHFYEQFLNEYDRQQRVQRGVFYTPDPVVEYIVSAVDQILQRPAEEGGFGIRDGLSSDATTGKGEPLVQILDPATGTGTFLAHIIDHIARRKNPRGQATDTWNSYVVGNLLKRLNGFELMMAPYTIAHLKLGLKLAQTGYTFGTGERLRVFLTNALEKPVAMSEVLLETDYLSREANEANLVKRSRPIMVIIGNPPYSGHSANEISEDWFRLNDYYFVDGQPLGERNPKWLQDDYVKFIRFGQWRIEQTGEGILAFISNHGYLDSPTFRGMRQQLMRAFDEIYILDLHGNSRKRETTPDGGKDENVFDIMQGVAIGIFVKRRHNSSEERLPARIFHRHLWGMREGKYNWLLHNDEIGKSDEWRTVDPRGPFYLFLPQDNSVVAEYQQGWKLTDFMSVNVLGFQTHRDTFAVDFDRNTLYTRLQEMRSEVIPDEEYHKKYELRDNRDWQLSRARANLRGNVAWETDLILCDYRPFDRRYCYFSEVAMDYPRRELVQNVVNRDNICLNTMRQTKMDVWQHALVSRFPTPAVYVEIKDGSSVFPLYEYPSIDERFDTEDQWTRTNGRRPNLSKAFVEQISEKLGLEFVTDGRGDLHRTFGPEDVFHYAYAIFHSRLYRQRYADQLKIDFPRLPLTTDVELFRQLVMRGVDLVALHLLEDEYEGAYWNRHHEPSPLTQPITRFVSGKNGSTVGAMSKSRVYDAEQKRIALDTSEVREGSYFEFVEDISAEDANETWEFQVGGYQVLHKWLYDRRPQGAEPGRTLTDEELNHYQRVVVALYLTRKLMDDIDEVIEEHGGFPLPGSGGDVNIGAGVEVEPTDELEEEDMGNPDWGEQQPKLIYTVGDQLPLGHDDDFDDDELGRPPDSAIELAPLQQPSVEAALTQLEGLEVETEEDLGPAQIVKPFDPSKIRMNSQQLSLDILVNRMRDKRISIPSYQRAEGIWNDIKKSRLIESILIKIPLPAFYIDARDDDNWRIIDGLQRLTTMRQFIIDKSLKLNSLEFLELNGRGYDDLPRSLQRRIEETPVTIYFVQEGTPNAVTYNIFKRINTGGEALSAQEIRNALHDAGPVVPFLDQLAKSPDFLLATGGSIKPLRRADQEVVLRFLAFALSPDRRPPNNDIDQFMNDAMDQINKMNSEERQRLQQRFLRVMQAAHAILGEYAFRKIMPSGRRGQISRALFDAWSLNLDALSDTQIERLSQKRPSSRLLARFRALINDDADFNRAITASTGDPTKVQYQYEAIEHIIQETLGA